jgi:hypothetical protein
MIKVDVQGEYYLVALPKVTLVMTKAEFITALRRGKWWKRRKAMDARIPSRDPVG